MYKKLPPAVGSFGKVQNPTTFTVHEHLMPYIEQDNLYTALFNNGGYAGGVPVGIVPPYLAPLDITYSLSAPDGQSTQNMMANLRVFADYLSQNPGFQGPNQGSDPTMGNGPMTPPPLAPNPGPTVAGLQVNPQPSWYGSAAIPRSFVSDGTSNTLAFATGYQQCPPSNSNSTMRLYWNTNAFFGYNIMSAPADGVAGNNGHIFQNQPLAANCDISVPQSMSVAGISVLMFDGHVNNVTTSVSPLTWAQAATLNDGQVFGQPNNDAWN